MLQFRGIVKHLVIINVIVFILVNTPIVQKYWGYLIVYYPGDPNFAPFQIVTHMFMHGDVGHLMFNMLSLVFLGPMVENYVGPKKFFKLYFLCGLGAVLLHFLCQYLGIIDKVPALGASGAVLGIVTAFATLFPNQKLMLLFFPVPISAKYLVTGMVLLDLFSGVTGAQPGVANFAHLGGAIAGFLLTYFWLRRSWMRR